MMQNTSIIYHPESLTEMQLISLIIFWSLSNYIIESEPPEMRKKIDDSGELPQISFLMWCLLFEHICGYLIEFFRHYDIEKNGQMDSYGVPRAKTESLLGTIQYFFICLIIGYVTKTLMGMDSEVFVQLSFATLWIAVDSIMMLFSRIYITVCMYLKISGEITKNIYTLHLL